MMTGASSSCNGTGDGAEDRVHHLLPKPRLDASCRVESAQTSERARSVLPTRRDMIEQRSIATIRGAEVSRSSSRPRRAEPRGPGDRRPPRHVSRRLATRPMPWRPIGLGITRGSLRRGGGQAKSRVHALGDKVNVRPASRLPPVVASHRHRVRRCARTSVSWASDAGASTARQGEATEGIVLSLAPAAGSDPRKEDRFGVSRDANQSGVHGPGATTRRARNEKPRTAARPYTRRPSRSRR